MTICCPYCETVFNGEDIGVWICPCCGGSFGDDEALYADTIGDIEDPDADYDWFDDPADPGDMDGDAETALASIGWGVDESYGSAADVL